MTRMNSRRDDEERRGDKSANLISCLIHEKTIRRERDRCDFYLE